MNLLHGIKGEFPEQEINWDTVLVADGDLVKPENVKVTLSKNAFNFEWDKDMTGIGCPNDRIMILCFTTKKEDTSVPVTVVRAEVN